MRSTVGRHLALKSRVKCLSDGFCPTGTGLEEEYIWTVYSFNARTMNWINNYQKKTQICIFFPLSYLGILFEYC